MEYTHSSSHSRICRPASAPRGPARPRPPVRPPADGLVITLLETPLYLYCRGRRCCWVHSRNSLET